MSNQTSSEQQSSLKPLSNDVVTLQDCTRAFHKYKESIHDYEILSNIAIQKGEKPPAKPTKSEQAKQGEQYEKLEDKTFQEMEKKLEQRQKDEQAKKTNPDSRQQIEALIKAVKVVGNSPEQLVKLAGLTKAVLRHKRNNPEYWQDLSTLLSVRKDLLQIETQIPDIIDRSLTDELRSDPELLANKHVLAILDKLTEETTNEKLKEQFSVWKQMGSGMKAFSDLQVVDHTGMGMNNPRISTVGLDKVFDLNLQQYNELIANSSDKKMLLNQIPEKFASLVLKAPESERLVLAAKAWGVIKAFMLKQSNYYSKDRSSEKTKVASRAVVSMIPNDQSLISALLGKGEVWLSPLLLQEVNSMFNINNNRIFEEQHDKYIEHLRALEKQEKEQKLKDQQQATEASRAIQEQAFIKEQQKLETLQQNLNYQKLISQLLNREPNQANLDQARQLINRNSSLENPDSDKLTPDQAQLFIKIIDTYQTMSQNLFTIQSKETSIKTGFLGLQKLTKTKIKYVLDPDAEKDLETKIKEMQDRNDPQALLYQEAFKWTSQVNNHSYLKD